MTKYNQSKQTCAISLSFAARSLTILRDSGTMDITRVNLMSKKSQKNTCLKNIQ